LAQVLVAGIVNDTHDLIGRGGIRATREEVELRADGVAFAEIEARRRLVDQRHSRRALIVLVRKAPALQQGDAEGPERTRRNLVQSNIFLVFCARGEAGDSDEYAAVAAVERAERAEAGRAHAGQPFDARQRVLPQIGQALSLVNRLWRVN